jgi:hypothetical protein
VAAPLEVADFADRFFGRQPVVVRGGCAGWPAAERWS